MDMYEKAKRLNDADFKQIIGVKRHTFQEMVQVLKEAYAAKHKRVGRPTKLSIETQLIMTLEYLRHYPTQKYLAYEYEVGEATVHDTIVWVEKHMISSCFATRLLLVSPSASKLLPTVGIKGFSCIMRVVKHL